MTGAAILSRIDQAYLKVDSTTSVADFRRAVESALEHGFRSLCLPPVLAGTAKKNFPALRVAAVVAYPLGLESLAQKEAAIRELINQGVDEVDVVYDLFALVNGNWAKIERESTTLGKLTSRSQVFQKAIIETPILSEDHLRRAVEILKDSPVDCIKTSTGFSREATSRDHILLIRQLVGAHKQIKASGGIKTLYQARTMLDAGADIIGTSSGVGIAQELKATAG